MSQKKLAINGFGRIGRTILREFIKRQQAGELQNIDIVAINNPGDLDSFIYLLKYDSIHGKFPCPLHFEDGAIVIGNKKIKFFQEKDPSAIPWKACEVDAVIDSTGVFKDKQGLGRHMGDTVKKVIMCAPGDDLDATFVFGINHKTYQPDKHHIVSNASCTTNCLAPVAQVLHQNFKILNGFMTTIHSYTLDQNVLDSSHKDFRRSRAAAMNMIPTSTGAAKAVGLVLPELKGKLDGYSIRVPTPDVSVVDLTVVLDKTVTKKEINQAMLEASQGNLKGILDYTNEPLVSTDFLGNPHSSIFDSLLTQVIGQQVKVVAWYDNEVGFSNRVLDLAQYVTKN